MNHYYDTVINAVTGKPLPGVQVSVLLNGALATIYSDQSGTPLSNPVTSDTNGLYSFYVAPGSYSLEFRYSGSLYQTIQNVLIGNLTGEVSVSEFMGALSTTAAIQAAVNALGDDGTLVFPPGTYTLTAPINITNADNIRIVGYGAKITAATRFQSYFNVSNGSRVTIEGFEFDQAKTALSTYVLADYPNIYNCPIYAQGVDGLTIRDCLFENLYTVAVYLYNCFDELTVENNRFTSPTQTQQYRMEHILIQTSGARHNIVGNVFDNAPPTGPSVVPCGIFISGLTGSATIERNFFNYCGRDNTGTHRVGAIDVYGDATNVRVIDNEFKNVMAQAMRLSTLRNAMVKGNRISVNSNAENAGTTISVESTALYFGVGQVGCQDVTIEDNLIEDLSKRAAVAIGLYSYDYGTPLTGIKVKGNNCIGSLGFVNLSGPFYDVRIEGNTTRGGRTNINVLSVPGGSSLTSVAGTEANSTYDRLYIRGNSHYDNSGDNQNAVNIVLSAATTAYTGLFVVSDNVVRANASSVAAAFSIQLKSSTIANTRCWIERNDIQGYATVFTVLDFGELYLKDNRVAAGFTTFLTSSNVTTTTRSDNRLTAGAMHGTATLVAGTATVSTAEIQAGDTVQLTRLTAGGTPGHLSLGTITAGTSFVINATGGADTSAIAWRIVH